jgi:hypothetical protein
MGCLTAPFKLLFLLAIVAALAYGWLHRGELLARLHRYANGPVATAPASATGRPGSRALGAASAKVDSLNGWRADSVVLTASEAASLIGKGLDPAVRSQLDSLRVTLGSGEIDVSASVATARLPRDLLGPFASAVGPREPIGAGGPVEVSGPGVASWRITRARIRNFPVPGSAIPTLLGRAFGDSARRGVSIALPAGVRDLRIRPSGVTLYGAPPR